MINSPTSGENANTWGLIIIANSTILPYIFIHFFINSRISDVNTGNSSKPYYIIGNSSIYSSCVNSFIVIFNDPLYFISFSNIYGSLLSIGLVS